MPAGSQAGTVAHSAGGANAAGPAPGNAGMSGAGAAGMAGAMNATDQTAPPVANGGRGGDTSAAGQAGVNDPQAAMATGGVGGSAGNAAAAGSGDTAGAGSISPAGKAAASLTCPSGTSYGDPLPAERTAQLVKDGFGFIEGPLWIPAQGVLLFSDMDFATSNDPNGPQSKIWQLQPPDGFSVLVEDSGSNGLALATDGSVLAATHDVQSLSRFDPKTGAREMLGLSYEGKHFNSPNDLAVRSDGNVYFSDPDWQLGPRTSETGMQGLYRVAPDQTVSLVDSSLMKPNGVALSPDERTLYVGSQGAEVFAYPLDDSGQPGERAMFASPGSSDGMSVDCAGNLYVVANTVKVYSSTGQALGEISVPGSPSNVAFGGPDQKTLYITAGSALYSIDLNVPGRAY